MTAPLLLLIAFQQQDRFPSCVLNADLSPPTFFLIRKKSQSDQGSEIMSVYRRVANTSRSGQLLKVLK